MKSFAEYLTESKKTYKFIVKVAGDLPEEFAETLETAMKKYDLVNVSSPKRTPIQETPLDFPQLQNMEVSHFEVEVNYPTTADILENYLQMCCNVPKTHLRVRKDGEPLELEQKPADDKPYESLLNTEDMGGESAQDQAGSNRVMELLKELEATRKEREIDPVNGIKPGDSKDIGTEENNKSTIGS